MRPLTKEAKPRVLADNESAWTQEYVDDVPAGNKLRRWAHPDIVKVLQDESADKCMYCEETPDAVTWRHVEHIKPKAKFPTLVVEWNNLGFACPRCNVAKGDYYDSADPVVDPYCEDPRDYLEFCGGLVRSRGGSQKGYTTIMKLQLARKELCERRMEQIEQVETLMRVWHLLEPGSAKDAVREEVWEMAAPGSRFSVSVADHLRHVGFPSSH